MADNYNAGQAGHYFNNETINELIEPFTRYTKKRNKKPPGRGQTRPSKPGETNNTTDLFIRDGIDHLKVSMKKVGDEILYKPTADSWLSWDLGKKYDYMPEWELTMKARKAWDEKHYGPQDSVAPESELEIPEEHTLQELIELADGDEFIIDLLKDPGADPHFVAWQYGLIDHVEK